MSSREEKKERLRREREAAEQQARKVERRGRLIRYATGAVLTVALVATIAMAVLVGGGPSDDRSATVSGGSSGLQAGWPPWPPETSSLHIRVGDLDLPAEGEAFHVHALLRVYVDGEEVEVPANIGIAPASGMMVSIHTHDDSGKIHMEAAEPHPFTLTEVFTVWGVQFSQQQLGGLKATGDKKLEVLANGRPVDPRTYELKDGDKLVVAYGKPGSAPSTFSS